MQREGTMQPRRRTTAGLLKQQTLAYLARALPPGWTSQPLAPAPRPQGKGTAPSADILLISPRGRCHFLFVRAPADRWWDGGPRCVPAEKITAGDAELARQLRAAGHKARAVWGERDLLRALRSWGCPLKRSARFAGARRTEAGPATQAACPERPTLHLKAWGARAHG